MINTIAKGVNDLKYVFVSIGGWTVAHIPEWIAHLADWFVILAQIGGGLAVAFGVLKMIDQFLTHRLGVDVLEDYRKRVERKKRLKK